MKKGLLVIGLILLMVIFAVSTLSGEMRLNGIISNAIICSLCSGIGYYVARISIED